MGHRSAGSTRLEVPEQLFAAVAQHVGESDYAFLQALTAVHDGGVAWSLKERRLQVLRAQRSSQGRSVRSPGVSRHGTI